MDALKALSRETQVLLAAAVLLFIISFFDWPPVSAAGITGGPSAWLGVGVVAGLLVVAFLLWEAARLFRVEIPLGELSPGLISVALALLVVLFTVITFLTHNEYRHWPAWVGLVLAIVIAVVAVLRARNEGVQIPDVGGRPGAGGDRSPAPPPQPESSPVDEEPPAPRSAP